MSLTLPPAYSNASKQGNIQENWIVQLGFFNGDAEGSGEGGWDATLQDDGTTANLINFIGSELVQDGDNPDHRLATWTVRDKDGNADGWGSGAPSPYSDDESASMINTLTGNAVDDGLPYSLTFTVGVAALSLTIGGGDLTGNSPDETFVAKAIYAVGTHTVTFTADADRSHLWFLADTASTVNGTIDDVTLKKNGYGAAETAIIVDDGTVFQDGDYIKIESEIIKIKSISTHTLTVARGAMGTTAAVHLNNTAIYWNNFTPISLADTTIDDVFYHGAITNKPSIRTSIDLAKSTAKTGNISLSVVNFQFKGDDFSAELFLGTRKYINRDVKIYSQLNGDSTLANCLQVYQGRLIDISHDDGSITLQLTEQRPWDFITVPQTLSNDKNYQPVAYGDFAFNYGLTGSADATEANKLHDADGGFTSEMQFSGAIVINTTDDTHSEITGFIDSGELTLGEDIFVDTEEYLITDFLSNKKFYPAPFDFSTANKRWNILTAAESGGDDTKPHYYNQSAKVFIPIAGGDSNTSSINGVNSVSYPVDFERVLNFRPNSINAGNEFDDPDHSYDSDIFNSESSDDGTATYGSTVDTDLIVGVPDVIGKFTKLYLLVRAYADLNATTGSPVGGVTLTNETYGTSDTIVQRATPAEGTGTNSAGTAGESEYYMRDMMTEYTNNDFKLPDEVKLNMLIEMSGGSGSISGSVRVYDIFFAGEIALDHTNEPDASQKILDDIDFVYVGSDGLSNSFTGGTGIADTGLEAHRDLLFRFTGFDDTDANIYNYVNDLDIEDKRIDSDADEDNWNIRWWALEPVELKKVLEQIQYEFCFIFKWRHDGTGSYWFIKDSYSSGDVTQTFKKDDITNLKINNTPFSQLLTQMEINYEKHPAENRYLSSQTSKDTTNNPRTVWNIQSKENIKEVNLDMNVNKQGNTNVGGGDPNDGFADYYMNIFGDIKKIISCDIVNPAVSYNLETGDIVKFSDTAGDMPVEPFGDNWADYYMITNLNRSPGKVSITAREVG